MLLNCFAQPSLLESRKTYLYLEELKKAPLLLCHQNALEDSILPSDWSGKMFATVDVLNAINLKEYTFQPASVHTLYPNEPYVIEFPNDEECQYKAKNIEITVIPWDKEHLMYLIRDDDNVVNLLTDMISEDMKVFVQNKILRNSIKSGIDVLYLNDGVYHSLKKIKKYPSEFLLGALVTIVRPRFIKGLFSDGDEQLPQHIEDCCMNSEICYT